MPDSLLFLSWCASLVMAVGLAYLVITAACGRAIAPRIRCVIAVVGLLLGQYFLALVLLAIGCFGTRATWVVIALGTAASASLLAVSSIRSCLALDIAELRASLAERHAGRAWPTRVTVGIAAVLAWSQGARGIVAPPLGWDFLTYHGPRAAFWVRDSALWPSFDAVGMWQQYRAYPPAGDMLTAWAISVTQSDLLVGPTWSAVWAGVLLMAYAAARSCGANRGNAFLGGCCVVLLPAVFHHMGTGYVDNVVLLAALCGTTCLVEGERSKQPLLGGVGLAGFAVAAAVKVTAAPAFAAAALLWLRELYLHRGVVRWLQVSAVGLVAFAAGTFWYGYSLVRTGNPVYPHRLAVLGMHWPGAPDSIPVGWSSTRLDFWGAARSLFFRGFLDTPWLHNGFGVGGLILLLAATITLLTRHRPRGFVAPVLLASGLVLLIICMSFRLGAPALDHGRYLAIVPALAAVGVASSTDPTARIVLLASIGLELLHALPWRWGRVDLIPIGSSAAVTVVVALAVAAVRRWVSAPLALVSGALAGFCCAAELRSPLRWDYYAAAARGQLMTCGPLQICQSSQAHSLWRELGEAAPMTIEVSAGNHPLLTHWYIYPLLGIHFQHQLVHVRTGLHFPDQHRNLSQPAMTAAASKWWTGVRSSGADAVFLYKPLPIEAALIAIEQQHLRRAPIDTPGAMLFFVR